MHLTPLNRPQRLQALEETGPPLHTTHDGSNSVVSPSDRWARPRAPTIPRPPRRSDARARPCRGRCLGSPRTARPRSRPGRTSSSRRGTWDTLALARRARADRGRVDGVAWARSRPSQSLRPLVAGGPGNSPGRVCVQPEGRAPPDVTIGGGIVSLSSDLGCCANPRSRQPGTWRAEAERGGAEGPLEERGLQDEHRRAAARPRHPTTPTRGAGEVARRRVDLTRVT